jgi:hypothetical protein
MCQIIGTDGNGLFIRREVLYSNIVVSSRELKLGFRPEALYSVAHRFSFLAWPWTKSREMAHAKRGGSGPLTKSRNSCFELGDKAAPRWLWHIMLIISGTKSFSGIDTALRRTIPAFYSLTVRTIRSTRTVVHQVHQNPQHHLHHCMWHVACASHQGLGLSIVGANNSW